MSRPRLVVTAADPQQPSDEQLMLQAAGGELSALEVLVVRHRKDLYNFLLRMVGDSVDADDLFQETWLRVFRARRTYEVRARFRTWLYRIATNLVLDERRRKQRAPGVSLQDPLGDTGETVGDQVADRGPSAAQTAAGNEALRRVEAALARLPEPQRVVVLLSHYQAMGQAEIAEALGVSVGTVKSRLFRAREQLERALGDLFADTSVPVGAGGQE